MRWETARRIEVFLRAGEFRFAVGVTNKLSGSVGAGVENKLKGSVSCLFWNSSVWCLGTGVCSKTLKSVGKPACKLRLLGFGVAQLVDSKSAVPSRRLRGLGAKRLGAGVMVGLEGCDRKTSNLIG